MYRNITTSVKTLHLYPKKTKMRSVAVAYKHHFGHKIGNHDNAWGPYICCKYCYINLAQWLSNFFDATHLKKLAVLLMQHTSQHTQIFVERFSMFYLFVQCKIFFLMINFEQFLRPFFWCTLFLNKIFGYHLLKWMFLYFSKVRS